MQKLCPTCGGVGQIPKPMPPGTVMMYCGPNGEGWPMVFCNSCGGTGWVMDYETPPNYQGKFIQPSCPFHKFTINGWDVDLTPPHTTISFTCAT